MGLALGTLLCVAVLCPVRQKIVKDASRRVRAEGMNGSAVAAVMRGTALTHGGFYKHFGSKDELLMESL